MGLFMPDGRYGKDDDLKTVKKYIFRKYLPEYKRFFTIENDRLKKVLGSSARIGHVGSTAVPSLGGKGIIDIVIGVSKSKTTQSKKDLENAGYEFRDKASYPERLFFRRDYPYKKVKRRVHAHLVELGGADWSEMIGFRDYLLKHPKSVQEYAKIKKEAVKKALGEGEVYRKHKEKFIKKITKIALKTRKRPSLSQ